MRGVAIVLCVFFLIVSQTQSQGQTAKSLITQQVDSSRMVALAGSLHPLARAEFDKGAAPGELPMEHIMLVLKRSPQQEATLQTLLQNQQDKSSPQYHQWLTPQQFGQQFGPSDDDIQSISTWLESNGFQLGHVSAGRTAIEFSGTAKAIQQAFHTEIRRYLIDGQEHWANATNPKIPTALEPAVAGIVSLHNFLSQPQIKTTGQWVAGNKKAATAPQLTFSNGVHALTPADYAMIYNINPLYQAGINGAGRAIAVLGRSNFKMQDVSDFRRVFGLPSNAPQIVLNGSDPGNLGGDE
ncbi:MAG TPA: protease pro-enzyme activation domain-containing protein, partial [Bryobacteraceae bacterium]